MSYTYRTEPYEYQRDLFRSTANKRGWCIFWDPRLGKSKVTTDTFSYLYQEGKIDCVMIVAPNGVHRNWVTDEIPVHCPEAVLEKTASHIYRSNQAKTKKAEAQREALLTHQGLSVLVVAYEATITANFKAFAKRLFAKRKVFLVLDESQRIKSSTSQTKTTLVAMAKHAKYVRCLSGTPVEVPTDIYPQVRAVDTEFWARKGLPTYAEFKNMFCVFASRQYGARKFEQIVGYKNIEILRDWVKEVSTRTTKEQAGLQLPPKVYTRRYHEMTSEQQRVYNELLLDTRTKLQSGDLLEVESPMVRLLRLQQIICGYVATGPDEPLQRICDKNPRLDLCLEICEDLPHQAVIFSRFTNDIDQICRALGDKAVRYDGTVDEDGRAHAKKRFQSGDVKFFVASDAAAEGLTLVGGKTMIFYANDFKLIKRLQKEDRCVVHGTPVLTPTGWVPIETVAAGDLVVGSSGQPRRVLDAWNRQCTKMVVEVTMRGWPEPIATTHDHQWLLENGEWLAAEQLRPGHVLAGPAQPDFTFGQQRLEFPPNLRFSALGLNTHNSDRYTPAPDWLPLDEETLFVLGYFAGDGFSSTAEGKGRFLSFSGNKTTKHESLERVRKFLDLYSVPHSTYTTDGEGVELRAYSGEWAFWFRDMFGHGARNKRLPSLRLGVQQSQWLLEGLVKSDGYVRGERYEYVTVSDTLAAQVGLLVSHSGKKPCFTKQSTGAHVVGWSESGPAGYKVSEVRFRNAKKTGNARERVYDLTVEDDAAFVCGSVVLHNCHRIGQTQSVTYIDLVCSGSVDEQIVLALRNKFDIANQLTGDALREWI
jgi:hypothetical protein